MLPRRISFRTLLIASIAGDVLDLFDAGLPILDLPVTILHFMFAGPIAALTLTEYIPIVGMLPLYTTACFLYLAREKMMRPRPTSQAVIDITPLEK